MSYVIDILKWIIIFVKILIDVLMKAKTKLTNVIWALVFAISFPISVFYLSKYNVQTPLALLIIVVNAILFVVFTAKQLQSIKSLDEVQIRIQLEAVSIAFILSLLVIMTFGMLGLVKALKFEEIDSLYIFAMLFLFYILGLIISTRRYR